MTDLFVAEHGDEAGPLLVVVHGSLDRSSAFVKVIRQLPDVHAVRYDRRGYAHSIDLAPGTSISEQVDDLVSVVAGRPAVLFGHSIGGVIALTFAHRHPELTRAVLAFEASMAWADWWPTDTAGAVLASGERTPAAAAERFMRRMVGDARWESLPERTKAQRRAEGPALIADLRSIRAPAPAPYEPVELRVPVVSAHGSESRPHHIEAARRLAAEAPGAELHVVDGAGHGVHLSHPAATADLVRVALARAGEG
ncbi:MAG: alpha/beta hydrolase [Actinomycetota bacterium]|nr:alpha/beta hydrolase [Actinomycetota bacterium]